MTIKKQNQNLTKLPFRFVITVFARYLLGLV